MNLLFVAEYHFANPDFAKLSTELAKKGHDVAVATSLRPFDSISLEQSSSLFQVKPFITLYRIPHSLSFPLSRIYKIVKEKNIQVVHALNDHSTNVATAALVSKIAGVPFVYTIQGPGTRTGHALVDAVVKIYDLTAERWIAKSAEKVILLSKSLASTAKKLRVKESKVTVIPSGIDSERFNPKRPEVMSEELNLREKLNIGDSFVLGFVGRLVPAKGLAFLFSAVKQIQNRHPNPLLLVVGEGPQKNELEAMARDLGIDVVFAGWQPDTRPYYSIMDVFVLPSLFEGLPNVILEAMAMGKPVIATKIGGNPDVLSNGENGFLVAARNSQQIASAIEAMIENEDIKHRMGAANREKTETFFQWSRTVEEVEKVYNQLS